MCILDSIRYMYMQYQKPKKKKKKAKKKKKIEKFFFVYMSTNCLRYLHILLPVFGVVCRSR